jgi:hypothetical protein
MRDEPEFPAVHAAAVVEVPEIGAATERVLRAEEPGVATERGGRTEDDFSGRDPDSRPAIGAGLAAGRPGGGDREQKEAKAGEADSMRLV